MNYDRTWYYEHPRNGFQDAWNRYYEYARTGGPRPSTLSKADSNRWKYELAGVPIIGDFVRASDNTRWMNDYLKVNQMTWADVKYPSRAPGAGSSARAIANTAQAFTQGALLRRMYR